MIKKYRVNDFYFSDLNIKVAYWAGFIAADGCVDTNYLRICLSKRDTAHLELLKEELCYTGPIYYGKNGKYTSATLKIRSDIIVEDLKTRFNIIKNKSLFLEPPDLNGNLAWSYIAGLIDGDGCLSLGNRNNKLIIQMMGTSQVMSWVKKQVDYNYPVKKPSNLIRQGNIWRYKVAGRRAEEVFWNLYNLNLPRLSRKWEGVINGVRTCSFVETDRERESFEGTYGNLRNRKTKDINISELGA